MNKKTGLFLLLTFALSWSMVLIFKLTGMEWTASSSISVTLPFMFTPMLSAIIVRKIIYREDRIFMGSVSLKPNRWFAVALLVTPLLAFATMGVSLFFPGITFSPSMEGMLDQLIGKIPEDQIALMRENIQNSPVHPVWLALIQGMLAGMTINAVAGFGEEYGWRELLFRETGHLGFWKSSLLTGSIWGIWHGPIILHGHNYPEHPVAGVIMMTVWCILLAPLFTYIRYKSRSVIAAAILHGTLNGTVGIAVMTVSGGNDLTRGMTGFAGFIVLAALNLILIPFVKKEKEPWRLQFNQVQ